MQSGPAGHVYVLLGADTLCRDRCQAALRRSVVGEEADAWVLTQARAGEAQMVVLLDSARTLPLVGNRRLVMVSGGEDLTAADMELLAEYAARPQPTTCLVVAAEALPAAAAAHRLQAAATVVDCATVRPHAVPRWLEGEVQRRGWRAQGRALPRLLEMVGDDTGNLAAALDKLEVFLAAGDARVIREADVAAVLSPLSHGTVWTFIEAVEDRDSARALRGLQALLEQGEAPESILRLLTRSRRQLLQGQVAQERGEPAEGVLDAMGVNAKIRTVPRVRQAILGRLRRHRRHEIVASIPRLLEADAQLKGGGGEARDVLTRLVLDLAGSAPPRP